MRAKRGINVCLAGKCPEDQPKLKMRREEQSAYFDYQVQVLLLGPENSYKERK